MEMSTLLSRRSRSESPLLLDGGRLLLHCTTNIMGSSSRRILTSKISANLGEEKEVFPESQWSKYETNISDDRDPFGC